MYTLGNRVETNNDITLNTSKVKNLDVYIENKLNTNSELYSNEPLPIEKQEIKILSKVIGFNDLSQAIMSDDIITCSQDTKLIKCNSNANKIKEEINVDNNISLQNSVSKTQKIKSLTELDLLQEILSSVDISSLSASNELTLFTKTLLSKETTESNIEILLPLTEISMVYNEDYNAYSTGSISFAFDNTWEEGNMYIVEWDGIKYACEYRKHSVKFDNSTWLPTTSGVGDPVINFLAWFGVNVSFPNSTSTGEPFFIFLNNNNYIVLSASEEGSHTVKIYKTV